MLKKQTIKQLNKRTMLFFASLLLVAIAGLALLGWQSQGASTGEELTYIITYQNGSAGSLQACSGQATLTWTISTLPAGGQESVSFRVKAE